MTGATPPSAHTPLSPLDVLRAVGRRLARSASLRLLMFGAVLWAVGQHGRPWGLGWLRMDEAEEIAAQFLAAQGAPVEKYTMIRAVERHPEGAWSARRGELAFSVNPAVGYRFRYFRPGSLDAWTVAVAPTGRIYRVEREQYDDDPGARLEREQAYAILLDKLVSDLGLPVLSLDLLADTLAPQVQRSDWAFTFAWPEALQNEGRLTVTLAGEALTALAFDHPDGRGRIAPHRSPQSSRVAGFALVLAGVFLIMHYHRTPLALKPAGVWGLVVFALTLAVRALTFPQAVILMPTDSPLTGYLSRVGLSALVEAVQSAILVGMVVATGEALSRDVFRQSTSLSRLAPGLGTWRAAWARAVRWAAPAAAIVLVLEAIAVHDLGPVGLCGKAPLVIANAFSSPFPALTLPLEVALDFVWEENVYRLWLLALLLFWLRLPVLAIPLAAGVAALFAGFDLGQLVAPGGLFYIGWGLVAGWLMLRVGIIAAMLFHLFVLGGYSSLVLFWTGFGTTTGAVLIGVMFLLILAIARDRPAA